MCVLSSLARRRGKIKCVLVMDAERDVLEREKGKEKTDEGSSVLLYFMTEEAERE